MPSEGPWEQAVVSPALREALFWRGSEGLRGWSPCPLLGTQWESPGVALRLPSVATLGPPSHVGSCTPQFEKPTAPLPGPLRDVPQRPTSGLRPPLPSPSHLQAPGATGASLPLPLPSPSPPFPLPSPISSMLLSLFLLQLRGACLLHPRVSRLHRLQTVCPCPAQVLPPTHITHAHTHKHILHIHARTPRRSQTHRTLKTHASCSHPHTHTHPMEARQLEHTPESRAGQTMGDELH